MTMARRPGLGVFLGVFLILTCAVSAAPAAGQAAGKAEAPAATTMPYPLCSNVTPSCGSNCTNTPFEVTKCWTTTYGPAGADVIVVPAGTTPVTATNSPNMLTCQGGAYALCFFSGPPTLIAGKNALPCILGPDGQTANCTCQYYSSGIYYVDINGILNQDAYYGAVAQCGPEGSGCWNIVNCPSGTGCPSNVSQANVCTYINNQSLGNPANSFYPKAQVVSTFSFAMTPPFSFSKSPQTCPKAKYAGCMTAPCSFADGNSPASHQSGDPIQCTCPVYDGEYQVGAAGQACTIPSSDGKTYIWSASNTVLQPSSDAKK